MAIFAALRGLFYLNLFHLRVRLIQWLVKGLKVDIGWTVDSERTSLGLFVYLSRGDGFDWESVVIPPQPVVGTTIGFLLSLSKEEPYDDRQHH